jgi:hypothetical protein
MLVYRIVRSLHGRRSLKSGKPGKDRLLGLAVQSNSPSTSGRELMIGCESEPLSLKSEYTLICKHTFNTFIMMDAFASRKSKRGELIVKREQEIAVKDLLLIVKNFWPFYLQVMGKA